MTVHRKHTTHVWRDIRVMVDKALMSSVQHHERMATQLDQMKQIGVDQDAGYEMIGRALGHGVLRPQQATIAMGDWKTARHEEFSERNLFSLYNCFTEGLKKGPAGDTMDRHVKAHRFFEPLLPGEAVTVAQRLTTGRLINDVIDVPVLN